MGIIHPFRLTKRNPTDSEKEDAKKLDEHLARHKRLKPPPYDFGPPRSHAAKSAARNEDKPVLSLGWGNGIGNHYES